MKFTGMHLHLILVAAVICVVLYVFYISRDIVLIDKEVKALHDRLDIMMKASPPGATPRPNAKPMPTTSPMVGGAPYPRPTPAPVPTAPVAQVAKAAPVAPRQPPAVLQQSRVTFISDDDDDDETEDMVSDDMSSSVDIQADVVKMEADDDDSQSDTTDKLKQMLDAEDTPHVTPQPVPAVPSFESLSWAEIKDRCKKLNITIRGSTKDQLIHKLKEASSAT